MFHVCFPENACFTKQKSYLLSGYDGPALVHTGSSSPAVRRETILKVLNKICLTNILE